jgi:F0F1-type ATP synthase membrane subunit b/b'
MKHGHLEMLEGLLAKSQRVLDEEKATFDECVKKANARLELKGKQAREKAAEERAEDLTRETEKICAEYHSKAKSQEDRFALKWKELEK